MTEQEQQESIAEPFIMIAERVDKQTHFIKTIMAILVAKEVCTSEELSIALDLVRSTP